MRLEEKIKKDLVSAIKGKDEDRKDAIRVILGEIPRLNKKSGELVSDEEMISIIKKLSKSESETLELLGRTESNYLIILKSYLPTMVEEDEISSWIKDNVDFSALKNKMQAMGLIMKNFGSRADGNVVKNVLINNF